MVLGGALAFVAFVVGICAVPAGIAGLFDAGLVVEGVIALVVFVSVIVGGCAYSIGKDKLDD